MRSRVKRSVTLRLSGSATVSIASILVLHLFLGESICFIMSSIAKLSPERNGAADAIKSYNLFPLATYF